MSIKLGRELQCGDVIRAWWGRDTILELHPYDGPLAHLWEGQGPVRLADFAVNKVGMTIEPLMRYEVLN